MGLNSTPNSSRYTIGLFGQINCGKSSLINALTGENIAITSDVRGTTTDPVTKAMELLPIGPILLIDTPGIDDSGELGEKRIISAHKVLKRCNLVLLVIDVSVPLETHSYKELIEKVNCENIPMIIVCNKFDLDGPSYDSYGKNIAKLASLFAQGKAPEIIKTNALAGEGITELKNALIRMWKKFPQGTNSKLLDGIAKSGDTVILVTPIDEGSPKGRLILPQQQVIRETLDIGAACIVTKETELQQVLDKLNMLPNLVITDSQVFREVSQIISDKIPLTSFSILFARQKGDLDKYIYGIRTLNSLKPGDRILISEACTHHRQCLDIGSVKIPRILSKLCKGIELEWSSGKDFPKDLSPYKLIIHCGACMLNTQEMQSRIKEAEKNSIPITNYGLLFAYTSGILTRALKPFGISVD